MDLSDSTTPVPRPIQPELDRDLTGSLGSESQDRWGVVHPGEGNLREVILETPEEGRCRMWDVYAT